MHALACRLLSFLCFIVIADKEKCMYLMIDNFDSFVYNLKAYFEEMGRCVTVKGAIGYLCMMWKIWSQRA